MNLKVERIDLARRTPRVPEVLGVFPRNEALALARSRAGADAAGIPGGSVSERVFDTWASFLVVDAPRGGICPGRVSYLLSSEEV